MCGRMHVICDSVCAGCGLCVCVQDVDCECVCGRVCDM